MTEFLKTLLFLNVQGSVLVILLLLLKKIIQRSFTGKAQRNLWILTAIVFLLPVWKLVPEDAAPPIILPYYAEDVFSYETATDFDKNVDRDFAYDNVTYVKKYDLMPWIWVVGTAVFLFLNMGSYMIFLIKKRKESKCVTDEVFTGVWLDINIKRKIRLKMCNDVDSPMLTGVIFPVVYMPEKALNEEDRRYIYRHELTHFVHKDLPIKWFVCFINAINWFNPFMYFVMKNLNEACEIYCDEAVTENMDDEGKKAYMNTILNLVAKKGESYV